MPARTQHAGAHDAALDVVAVDPLDAEHDRAVGEEHLVADAHPLRELGNGGGDSVLVAFDRLRREHEAAVHAQLDLVVLDGTRAQLRTGKIDEHADDAVERSGRGRATAARIGVHVGSAVGGVEPHDVDARGEQRLQRVGFRRCRPDRRHDLGSPHGTSSVLHVLSAIAGSPGSKHHG